MFATPIAKSQAKPPTCSTTSLVRPSSLVARGLDRGAVKQAHLLHPQTGDEAAIRTSLPEGRNQSIVESPSPSARPPTDTSWSLRDISIFPPDRASRGEKSMTTFASEQRAHGASLVQSPRVPGLVQAKL